MDHSNMHMNVTKQSYIFTPTLVAQMHSAVCSTNVHAFSTALRIHSLGRPGDHISRCSFTPTWFQSNIEAEVAQVRFGVQR